MLGGEMLAPQLAKAKDGLFQKKEPNLQSHHQSNKNALNRDKAALSKAKDDKDAQSFSSKLKAADKKLKQPDKEVSSGVRIQPKEVASDGKSNVDRKDTSALKPPVPKVPIQNKEVMEPQIENPISKFMDSMENELGVEPERLIEAIGTLSDEDLMKDPEETMEQILSGLQLDPQSQDKAKELYKDLMSEWKPVTPSSVNADDGSTYLGTDSLLKGLKKEQVKVDRKESIDAMAKKFFDVYPKEYGRSQGESSERIHLPPQGEVHASGNPNGMEIPEGMEMIPAGQQKEAFVDNQQEDFLAKMSHLMKQESDVQASANESLDLQNQPEIDPQDQMMKKEQEQAEQLFSKARVESSRESDSSGEFFSGDQSQGQNGESAGSNSMAQQNVNQKDSFAKVQANAQADANNAAETEKISELVDRVSILAKKGGGEMKVKMNSQEMGDMHLKVAVKEGKVDVQMLTESKDAKKLIESDLAALKVELGNKNLELNEVKVDVSKDLKGELDQQMADQKREEAREFLKEFRDNNAAFKQFASSAGLGNYMQAKDPDSLDDRVNTHKRLNHNGRLSIVAEGVCV